MDMTDIDNPVQTYVKTANLNPLPGKVHDTTLYFEPNTFLSYEDQTGFIPFLPSPDPVTFFTATRPETIINERTVGLNAPRATIRFELSDQKYTHTRRFYTINTLFISAGSFSYGISMIPIYIMSYYASNLYQASLLEQLPVKRRRSKNSKKGSSPRG